MEVHKSNPLSDPRWSRFVDRHPKASVFHTTGWLKSLSDTYGYEPVVFTTEPPSQELRNAIVFCRIKSWITGARLVSLPFADHCQPLCERVDDLYEILEWVRREELHSGFNRIEIRPLTPVFESTDTSPFCAGDEYRIHILDLSPPIAALFAACDKDSVQRRVRRAQKQDLQYEESTTPETLNKFYELMVLTRRRHGLPPQPKAWFQSVLANCQGKASIRLALHDDLP